MARWADMTEDERIAHSLKWGTDYAANAAPIQINDELQASLDALSTPQAQALLGSGTLTNWQGGGDEVYDQAALNTMGGLLGDQTLTGQNYQGALEDYAYLSNEDLGLAAQTYLDDQGLSAVQDGKVHGFGDSNINRAFWADQLTADQLNELGDRQGYINPNEHGFGALNPVDTGLAAISAVVAPHLTSGLTNLFGSATLGGATSGGLLSAGTSLASGNGLNFEDIATGAALGGFSGYLSESDWLADMTGNLGTSNVEQAQGSGQFIPNDLSNPLYGGGSVVGSSRVGSVPLQPALSTAPNISRLSGIVDPNDPNVIMNLSEQATEMGEAGIAGTLFGNDFPGLLSTYGSLSDVSGPLLSDPTRQGLNAGWEYVQTTPETLSQPVTAQDDAEQGGGGGSPQSASGELGEPPTEDRVIGGGTPVLERTEAGELGEDEHNWVYTGNGLFVDLITGNSRTEDISYGDPYTVGETYSAGGDVGEEGEETEEDEDLLVDGLTDVTQDTWINPLTVANFEGIDDLTLGDSGGGSGGTGDAGDGTDAGTDTDADVDTGTGTDGTTGDGTSGDGDNGDGDNGTGDGSGGDGNGSGSGTGSFGGVGGGSNSDLFGYSNIIPARAAQLGGMMDYVAALLRRR